MYHAETSYHPSYVHQKAAASMSRALHNFRCLIGVSKSFQALDHNLSSRCLAILDEVVNRHSCAGNHHEELRGLCNEHVSKFDIVETVIED